MNNYQYLSDALGHLVSLRKSGCHRCDNTVRLEEAILSLSKVIELSSISGKKEE